MFRLKCWYYFIEPGLQNFNNFMFCMVFVNQLWYSLFIIYIKNNFCNWMNLCFLLSDVRHAEPNVRVCVSFQPIVPDFLYFYTVTLIQCNFVVYYVNLTPLWPCWQDFSLGTVSQWWDCAYIFWEQCKHRKKYGNFEKFVNYVKTMCFSLIFFQFLPVFFFNFHCNLYFLHVRKLHLFHV